MRCCGGVLFARPLWARAESGSPKAMTNAVTLTWSSRISISLCRSRWPCALRGGASSCSLTDARTRRQKAQAPITDDASSRPQPREGAPGQQPVNQTIDRVSDGRAQAALVPDHVLPVRHCVCEKCRGARKAKDSERLAAWCDCGSGYVRSEDADHHTIEKPLDQLRSHCRRPGTQDR